MEKLLETDKIFQTGKKASKKRPVGWALRLLRFLFNLVLVIVSAALIVVSGLYGYVIYAYGDQLDRTYPDLAQYSSVYDANGDRMGEFEAEEDRQTVGPEGLGEYLPQAAVAVEDRRFYDHWGMDVTGVSRAAWEDLRALAVNQGVRRSPGSS